MMVSKGTAGVWVGTNVRLFRVQEVAMQSPSLMKPRGAVDAVGRTVVERIGSLNLRGATSNGASGANGGGRGSVRDV
jgi:hypothetical protein